MDDRISGRDDEAAGQTGPVPTPAAESPAERQLRISEERYRLLAEHFNDVVWTMSVDGRITYVSPSVERMRGITPDEAMRQALEEIHPPASAAISGGYFIDLATRLQTGQTPEPFRGELEYYCKNGSTVWTEVQVIPHIGPHGEVVEIIGVTRDISERKRAEEEIRRLNEELEERVRRRSAQLVAANRELEDFIYSAAHDLRSPLRAIDGFSQCVADDAADRLTPEDLEHLQRVRAAAQRMGVLIDHLQLLARSASETVRLEEVDVSALATSVLDDLRLGDGDRDVDTVVQPGIVTRADVTLLRAVLTALLDNAWKFTAGRDDPLIEVGALSRDGELAYFVRDNGVGFSADAAEHIFRAFERGHTQAELPGEGFGLAMVRRLVARHGGRAWAEGASGRGATFFFTLPAEPAEPAR